MTILNTSTFLKSLDKVMSPILGHIHSTEVTRVINEFKFKSKGIFRCCQWILNTPVWHEQKLMTRLPEI